MGDTSNPPSQPPPSSQSLHPVYTVTNIQNKIRILDGVKVSYSSWVKLFMLHAKGYDVVKHIDGSPAPDKTSPEFSTWEKIDAVVLQWIYGTLSDDLLVRVLVDESTARDAWLRVQKMFLNNKGPRAQALQHELANLSLSSMSSLEAYCQRIREITDQLAVIGFPVSENQKVLHLVRGLPREYETTASILNNTLPSWEDACDQLLSESQRIAARESIAPTPLVAAVTSHPSPRVNTSNSRDQSTGRNHRPNNPRREQGRNHRTNNRGSNPSQQRHPAASYGPPPAYGPPPYSPSPYWASPPYWAPPPCPYPTQGWTGPWQQRPPGNNNSNYSAQSKTHMAQAHLAETDPLQPTQLADAVQALSMEQADDEWHFDTGASSHVTFDEGLHGWHDPESPQQFQ